jgi:antitoxin component of MazEF toxin-antitoxin module
MKKTSFKTTIKGFGNNAGIEVPLEVLDKLGAGKRPALNVAIGSYGWKGTVGAMGGMYLISFSKAHREALGLAAGDAVTVDLELDEGAREVEVPKELQEALSMSRLTDNFAKLTYSKRKEFSRQVTEAKLVDTKERRISKIIETLS